MHGVPIGYWEYEDESNIRHWHIQLRKRDGLFEMHLHKKEAYVDLSKYLI